MIKSFKFIAVLLAFATTLSSLPAASNPPSEWRPEDTQVISQHLALEIASFPSRMLAASVAESLKDMGWNPVRLIEKDGKFTVTFGLFSSPARAVYFQETMKSLEIAEPKIISLSTEEVSALENEDVFGPSINSFEMPYDLDAKWFLSIENQEALRQFSTILSDDETSQFLASLNDVRDSDATPQARGVGAVQVVRMLHARKLLPKSAYYLSYLIATEEFPVPKADQNFAKSVMAHLQYGHYRDWISAYASSRELSVDPDRQPDGRAEDRLRMIALEVELAKNRTGEYQVYWPNIRSRIREVYNIIPETNKRAQAKAELIYLQTFAWEGNWERVEVLAKEFLEENADIKGEVALAKIYYARSQERTGDLTEARQILAEISNELPTRRENLFLGYEPFNVAQEVDKWDRYFRDKIQEEKGLTLKKAEPILLESNTTSEESLDES